MVTRNKHTLDNHDGDSVWLPLFLNTGRVSERKRVFALLEKMRLFAAMCDAERESPTIEPHEFGLGIVLLGLTPEAEALLAEINQALDRYRTKLVIEGASLSGKGLWVRQKNVQNNWDFARQQWHVTESAAVQMLVNMAKTETLDRLKQCGRCERWFSGKSNKTFCSITCRRSHQADSEEFKAHRREYMRKNYQLRKARAAAKNSTLKEFK